MSTSIALFHLSTTYRRVALFLLVLITVFALTPQSPALSGQVRAQPQLLALAAAQPAGQLRVIVQKESPEAQAEAMVRALGGVVTQDLAIINAFAAKLPARSVSALARAAGIRWISLDGAMVGSTWGGYINTWNIQNAYVKAIRADRVWNLGSQLQGQGVGVAVVDSGVDPQQDLYTNGTNRLVASVFFNEGYNQHPYDVYGHGNHVAGIIAGNGDQSDGDYIGVAPRANIINVKVNGDQGGASASSVVAGLQWILNNKSRYNIRVVNISMNSEVAESYHTSPINAAVEILWFNKIVVVVSAGNHGSARLYPPANDPFVITVGATNDRGTASIYDDHVAPFSAFGTTVDGFSKPELVAPGRNIIAPLPRSNSVLATEHPENVLRRRDGSYFTMSGTSMAAPMVSGAVAILLQDDPWLTPDQVKYRLMATANRSWAGYNTNRAGAGYLDVEAAVWSRSSSSANTGIRASKLLWTGSQPVSWNSVNWNSVNWNSVNWNSVNWNSVNWNSVNWNSDYWE